MPKCFTCPFDGGEAVESAINLGCVPDVFDIMRMKREQGLNWGCHDARPGEVRPCAGFIRACVETGQNHKTGEHLAYADWFNGDLRVPVMED